MITRRDMLRSSSILPFLASGSAAAFAKTDALLDELDCGVASGDPSANSMVLWTRIPRGGRDPQSPDAAVTVYWQLATTKDFSAASIVQEGKTQATIQRDFNVHVQTTGLAPATEYFFRFRSDYGFNSQVGRTKTFPASGSGQQSCRLAAVSCQMYSAGYFHVFSLLANGQYDLILHLGDTVYEKESGKLRDDDPLRGREAVSLLDYRLKHRLYLSDPAVQAARRSAPWIYIWDDHEVVNDYSGQAFMASGDKRMRAGQQAFAEYMPMLPSALNQGALTSVQLYRQLRYGDLINFLALDGRQYRSDKACTRLIMTSGCDERNDPTRTMLGKEQKAWLKTQLSSNTAKWNVLVSDMVFSPLRANLFGKSAHEPSLSAIRKMQLRMGHEDLHPERFQENKLGVWYTLDGWDGFTAEREELLRYIAEHQVKNMVVFAGDIHASIFAKLATENGTIVGHEIVVPSVTSKSVGDTIGFLNNGLERLFRQYNENLLWQDMYRQGYVAAEITADKVTTTFYHVDCKKSQVQSERNFGTEIRAV